MFFDKTLNNVVEKDVLTRFPSGKIYGCGVGEVWCGDERLGPAYKLLLTAVTMKTYCLTETGGEIKRHGGT